jgi:hypothetical protein
MRALALSLVAGCSQAQVGKSPLPFSSEPSLELPGAVQAASIHAVDLNKDSRLDLVVLSGSTARISIVLAGDAGYRIERELDAGQSASGCAIGDFNSDGRTDIAVTHHDSNEMWVFLGKDKADFEAPSKVRFSVSKPHAHMVLVADANGDGVSDLFVAQSDDNTVWVLIGDGKGGFSPSAGSPISTGNHPYVVTAADFNGDGHLDFATPNWYGRSVSAFLGDGKGSFKEAPNSPITGFAGPTAVAAADLTGDGHIDLAVGNDDSSRIEILVGDGKGAFAKGAARSLEAGADCFAPIIADLNGDGRSDVVATAVNDAPTFSYWINQGNGRFSEAQRLRCEPVASRILVSDLNRDGVQDLIVGAWDAPKVFVWYGRRTE